KNTDIARVFTDIADLLELKGENVFKVRAYQKAARSIEHLPLEAERLVAEDRLRDIPGVGEAIGKKITELVATGKLEYYEELKKEFPEGISTFLDIPGVGPKTAIRFAEELGLKTVEELEAAIRDGRVAALPRMGEKSAENILHAIEALRRKDQRIPIGEALPLVDEILGSLGQLPGVKNLSTAGSLRRFRETIGDLDLMGTADDPEAVVHAFVTLPFVRQVLARGPTKASILVSGGLQVDLRFVEHDSFGALLQYFTGSKQHNIDLRERGRRQGLKLSEYGITDVASGKLEKFATEEAFYRRLGLQYIPPELREAMGEIERAEAATLPNLVEEADMKGDLHVHSEWSDGHDSIKSIALAARERGYEYIAITDHSAGRGIARGLSLERLEQQREEIRRANAEVKGIRLLAGSEVDIRADGSLDMPPEEMGKLDFVVASVHSAMGQDMAQMTRRVVKALESGLIDVLAHPTCRLLTEREPVALDMEAVFQAAARSGVALEINAMPDRLDLKDIHAFRARELGVKLIISTDAHSIAQLGLMRFGIGVAKRAWCEPAHILNTRPLAEFMALLPQRAGNKGPSA
ncbi:MAG: DNA polymerase/3'-5' exonuclease PolX, partial [Dehalococcoidia bacterium]|nr:DNA polymerase/3'-5' exonuclease PolX [Dehalococcoidia bacterium]